VNEPRRKRMGRAFSDDLRMRIAAAEERGEGSCRALAARFGVSFDYVRNLRRLRKRTGSAARPLHRTGSAQRKCMKLQQKLISLPVTTCAIIMDAVKIRTAIITAYV
jgi:transposase